MTKKKEPLEPFRGFKVKYRKDFFTYPTELEGRWHELTGAEQKILDFILRMTLGFQKTSDFISISQFVNGNGPTNKGSGVSRAHVPRSIKALEEKGYITVGRRKFQTMEISLMLEKGAEPVEQTIGVPPAEIARLIELFRPISGHQTDGFKQSKSQIKAMELMVAHYGIQAVEQTIQLAHVANGKEYAPRITSPAELDKKWPSLMSFLRREKNQKGPTNAPVL